MSSESGCVYHGHHSWHPFNFCCVTCDVSTLVGMTRNNICIIKMLGYNRLESSFLNRFFFINYLTLLLLCCHVILGMNRMIFIMKYHF